MSSLGRLWNPGMMSSITDQHATPHSVVYFLNREFCFDDRQIDRWIHKGYETSKAGCTVVMLLPARTDTSWWHALCMRGEIRFLRGRLNFNDRRDHTARAPFPSAIVIFRPERNLS